MKLVLILLALGALRPNACRPPEASAIAVVDGHLYGVVHLDGWMIENASNAGGLHYTFSIVGLPDRLVHAGGHSTFGDDVTLPGMGTALDDPWPRRYYLAELALDAVPIGRPCPSTWCTYPMPTYHGHAHRLVPAASLAAARAMLAAIPRTGYPAGEAVFHH